MKCTILLPLCLAIHLHDKYEEMDTTTNPTTTRTIMIVFKSFLVSEDGEGKKQPSEIVHKIYSLNPHSPRFCHKFYENSIKTSSVIVKSTYLEPFMWE